MVNKKSKQWIIGFVVLFALVGFALYSQGFVIVGKGDKLNIPEYSSIWCAPCDTGSQVDLEDIYPKSFEEEYRKYTCSGGYIPLGCNFEIEAAGGVGELGAYVCSPNVNENTIKTELDKEITPFKDGGAISACQFYNDTFFDNKLKRNIKVAQGDTLYLLTEENVALKYDYQTYCLRSIEKGLLTSTSGCTKNQLVQLTKDVPDNLQEKIPFGETNAIKNVVIGYSALIDSVNAVQDPTTKQSVYLQRPFDKIQSCKIEADKNNEFYVDTKSCKDDARFTCLPSQPPTGYTCVGGTQLIQTSQGNKCSGNGLIAYDINEETQEKCAVYCQNGKQSIGQCKEIVGFNKGKVDPISTPPPTPQFDYRILFIGAIIFIVAVALILVANQRRK